MKRLLLALLWWPLVAGAWCTMPPPANPSTTPQVQIPNKVHTCWPAKWGLSFLKGQGYIQRDFAAVPGATAEGGSCSAWWCQAADGTWGVESHCALARYTAGGIKDGLVAALAAPDPLAAAQAFADKYVVVLTDPQQINDYNCLHVGVQQLAQATKPASGVVYKVPSGGSAVYPVVNGKLGVPLAGRRAPGNTLCDLTKLKVVVGAYTYGAFDGSGPAEAALCVKV